MTPFANGLLSPFGLAFDASGNLFVAEYFADQIIQINTTTGAVATFATGLSRPIGLAFDASGNLFVAESGSNQISQINTTTGVVTPFTTGLSGPNGLVFDASGNLFVAEESAGQISQINTTTGAATPFITGLSGPAGLASDASGNLFVAEFGSSEISQVNTTTGAVTTFATGLSRPIGLAFDASGTLFVTESGSGEVICFSFCPTITPINDSNSVCANGTTAQNNWHNQVAATAPNSGVTGPAYSGVPIGHATFPTPAPNATYTGDNCTVETELHYAYYTCTATNEHLAAGTLTLTLYPDISTQNNVVLDDGSCCPSFQLACTSDYTVTNDYDGNGAHPDCNTEIGQNTIQFTVSSTNGSCPDVTYKAAYNCLCPRVLTEIADTQYLCQTGLLDSLAAAQTGVYQDDLNTLAGISFWLDNNHPPTQAISTPLAYAGNGCDPDTVRVYAFALCDENQDGFTGAADDSYLSAGLIVLVLFPDISQQVHTILHEGFCCPQLTVACPQYTVTNTYDQNGPTPDCSQEVSNGALTFLITNPIAPPVLGHCWQDTLPATYDCRVCPQVITPLDQKGDYCQTTSFDYLALTDSIVVNNSSNTSLGISYWLDPMAMTEAPADWTYSGAGCATQADTIYALLACDIDQDGAVNEWLFAGTIAFQLFPDFGDLQVTNDGGCCPFISFPCTEADGFLITNTYDNQGASPDCSAEFSNGTMQFTIVNQNAPADLGTCTDFLLSTTYDCRICPTVTIAVNWSEAFCVEGQPNYNGAAATVSVDDPSQVSLGVYFWLDETYTTPAPETFAHVDNHCTTQTLPIYATVACDRNQDGTPEEQLPAGDFVVTLYPAPQAPVINRILVENNDCQYEVIPACPDDVLDTPTFGPLPVVSFAGNTEIAVTSSLADSPCPTSTFTVDYQACSNCPFTINIIEQENATGTTQFYNTIVLEVTGALPPFEYDFDREGFLRKKIQAQTDPIGALVTLQYSNTSTWAMTITDDAGCVGSLSNTSTANEHLAIDNANITATSGSTNEDGTIALTVSGGTLPYTYAWGGVQGFTANTPTIADLHYGWYHVTVTDNSIPQQQQTGFYWVASNAQPHTGGFIRGKHTSTESTFLKASPNPVQQQTTLHFRVTETARAAEIAVYTTNGQKIKTLYAGVLPSNQLQTVSWHTDGWAAGLYLVQLTTETGVQQQLRVVVMP